MKPLPPYADLLGLTCERDAAGMPTLVMPFREDVIGRPGWLHGGAISGLLEIAAIVALWDALDADDAAARIKPINVTVDFMRGGRDHATYARALVTRLGTRVANVEARAWQGDPTKPIAAARMNWLVARSGT